LTKGCGANEKPQDMKDSKRRESVPVNFALLLLISAFVEWSVAFEGLGDIHDEKYSSPEGSAAGSEVPSERRVLLISPQKQYLANRSVTAYIL